MQDQASLRGGFIPTVTAERLAVRSSCFYDSSVSPHTPAGLGIGHQTGPALLRRTSSRSSAVGRVWFQDAVGEDMGHPYTHTHNDLKFPMPKLSIPNAHLPNSPTG